MPIRVDMGSAESSPNFDPFPIGDHPFVIESLKLSDNPGPSGYRYIDVTFRYDAAAGELDESFTDKRKQWTKWSLSPKALWRMKEDLTNLGVEVPDEEFELDEQELIGLPVMLTLGIEDDYKGRVDEDGNVLKQNTVEKVMARESWT